MYTQHSFKELHSQLSHDLASDLDVERAAVLHDPALIALGDAKVLPPRAVLVQAAGGIAAALALHEKDIVQRSERYAAGLVTFMWFATSGFRRNVGERYLRRLFRSTVETLNGYQNHRDLVRAKSLAGQYPIFVAHNIPPRPRTSAPQTIEEFALEYGKSQKEMSEEDALAACEFDPNDNVLLFDAAADRWYVQAKSGVVRGPYSKSSMEQQLVELGANPRREMSRARSFHARDVMPATTERLVRQSDGRVIFNDYEPPALIASPAPFPDIHRMLLNLANGNVDFLDYLLDWLAAPLQAILVRGTTLKLQTAIVLHGREGTGKGLLSRILKVFYGKHLVVVEQKGLDSRFTDQLANGPLFIFANEVESSSNRTSETTNRLKAWITDDTIEWEAKYQPAKNIANRFNILFASNDDRPVVVSGTDRRYTVKHQTRKLDQKIGARIAADIDGAQTQVAGFLWFLLRRRCKIKVGQIYATRDKEEVRAASAPSDIKFAREIQKDGWLSVASSWVAAGRTGEQSRTFEHEGFVANDVLKQVYRHFCALENVKPRGCLGKTISDALKIESRHKTIGNVRQRGYYLPMRGEDEPRLVEQIHATMRPEDRRPLEPEAKTYGA